MKHEDSYAEFRRFLRDRGRTLKSLRPPEGVDLMLEFYKAMPFDCAAEDGNGIAYSCSILHRGRGSRFEFSLIRIYRSTVESTNVSRLRLSFCFPWLDVVKWLARPDHGLHESNGFAWSPDSVQKISAQLGADATYQVIKDKAPKAVELRREAMWGIYG